MCEHCSKQHLCLLRPSTSVFTQQVARAKPSNTWPLLAEPIRTPRFRNEHAKHISFWIELHKSFTVFVWIVGKPYNEAGEVGYPNAFWKDNTIDKEK
jgi:hypothetical protein